MAEKAVVSGGSAGAAHQLVLSPRGGREVPCAWGRRTGRLRKGQAWPGRSPRGVAGWLRASRDMDRPAVRLAFGSEASRIMGNSWDVFAGTAGPMEPL